MAGPGGDTAQGFSLRCDREQGYRVALVDHLLAPERPDLAATLGGRRSLVVTTPTVQRLLGPALERYAATHQLDLHLLALPLSESTKRLDTAAAVCDRALALGIGRRDVLVALGGGVCCDVVSVAASLLRRGTPLVCLPTTLLGQVDAGIGVKGAVNADACKNGLGFFQPPEAVLIDVVWLSHLPTEQVSRGMAEVLKIATVTDEELFTYIEGEAEDLIRGAITGPGGRWVVQRSIELMLEQLAENWFEDRSFERVVDFGHTFSGAIETRSGFAVSHGEAVALDMAFSVAIGRELGLTPRDVAERTRATLRRLGLPVWSDLLDHRLVEASVGHMTAHRGGHVNLVVPTGIGRATFVTDARELTGPVVDAALRWLATPG